ncbi:heterokaryon incompatibility protein-domain-containing protein [Fusarium flagelliforme]|uniref:heterokaryon incompatibility protein-domain-containing protein n=1 Tax=Fusarium flagelliforme TaxID=2675880 RepID=UPI001E8E4065|nr:heterokaryon incompatibility protein-domain-containing protein [Fusarium flagelliforme]KAH7174175.1 heterokaryon incompatibility protein-domain-containing protein [Fusarium flagelliforme]
MTTSVQDLSVPRHQTSTWSEVECCTRVCQRCEKVPFHEEAFHGFDGSITVSDTGCESLHLSPDELHDKTVYGQYSLEVDFKLVDNWPQLPVLTKSAKNCDLCNLLETRLRKTQLPPGFKNTAIHMKLFYYWRNGGGSGLEGLKALVYGKLKQDDEFSELVWLTFTIDANEGECKRWLRLQQRPPAEFLSGEYISKITARLERLENNRTSTFLPTRLIDLGCHDKSSTFVRLVTKEIAFNERYTSPMYVALSYPWGSPEQAARQSKTTLDNIRDRMISIDLQTLSKVIQDAAIVCKLIGVRYLWVDALCIIQGDIQDWERESTTMGKIFRSAYLTIGAATIESCHGSFLSPNIDALEIPFVSRIKPRANGTYRLVAQREQHGRSPCFLQSTYFTDITGPWETRGWVFQEVAMSTRLLVFGRTIMALETSEEGLEELPSWFNLIRLPIDYSTWRSLVQNYSSMKLTFKKDTFPAISGLARFFAEHLEDEYLAGIWKKDIYISLFWHSTPPQHLERQSFCASINRISSRPYIAPSWSWAAEKHYSEFGTYGFHPVQSKYHSTSECHVIDAGCIVEGLDPFGVVQSGYLVLSSKVLRLQEGRYSFTPTPGWERGHHDWYLDGGTRVMQTLLDGDPEWNDPDIHRVLFLLLGSCEDRGIEAIGKFRNDGAPNGERCAYGLVLYPAQGANSSYRVGLFNSQVRNHAPNGGLKLCDNWQTEKIAII